MLPSTRIEQVLVYEHQPYWLPTLQWQMQETGINVLPIPDLLFDPNNVIDGHDAETASPVLISTLDAVLHPVLPYLQSRTAAEPTDTTRYPLIVIASPEQLAWEWPLRELGASAVVEESIPPAALAHLCQRLLGTTGNCEKV